MKKTPVVKKRQIVTVRKHNSLWLVRHPITGVEFVERTPTGMKDRVIDLKASEVAA